MGTGEEQRQESVERVRRPVGARRSHLPWFNVSLNPPPPAPVPQPWCCMFSAMVRAAHDGDSCGGGRRGGSCTLVQGHAMVPREAMGAGGGGARVVVRGGFARARRRWGRDELGLVGVGGFGRQRIWSDLDPRGRQEVVGWGGFEHHLPLPEVLMPNHSELI